MHVRGEKKIKVEKESLSPISIIEKETLSSTVASIASPIETTIPLLQRWVEGEDRAGLEEKKMTIAVTIGTMKTHD